MTHISVCNQTIIGSDNGLLPGRHQAIIWTSAGILLIGPLGTNKWNLIWNSYMLICDISKRCLRNGSPLVSASLHYVMELGHHWFREWLLAWLVTKSDKPLVTLTHCGQDKMAAIFQTTFWNGFSWFKMCEFWLKFQQNLFPGSNISNYQYSSVGSDNGLAPIKRQAIIWASDGPAYSCIFASLSLIGW